MDIKELKNKIESNTLTDDLLILKYEDSKYLCNQYVDTICKNKKLNKVNIQSIYDINLNDDIFDSESSDLYVLDVDELKEYPTNEYKNLIILCKKVPDNLTVDFIKIPKLVNWQIEDYVAMRLPGLSKKEVEWLCSVCQYDIYRLNQECNKLEIFLPNNQLLIFNLINQENGYCDLNTLSIFDLSDAIIKLDSNKIEEVLSNRNYIDLEPAGLLTILITNYKKLISVYYSNAWNSSLNVSDKQYNYYKKFICNKYNKKYALVNILECLTEIDYLLKSGVLDYNNIIDYIICNIFSFI